MKPLIGVAMTMSQVNKGYFEVNSTYLNRVVEAEGIPLVIPANIGLMDCKQVIQKIDGLLLPGGIDIDPALYGEEAVPKVTYIERDFDLVEIELTRLAREYKKPVFGICRGIQIINVAFGGTLYQDIPSQYKNEICHMQNWDNTDYPIHKVILSENSHISKILGKTVIETNSHHHQSVKRVAEGFNITGRACDGVIEAIESEDGLVIGVQWHPEKLASRFGEPEKLFKAFIEKCKGN